MLQKWNFKFELAVPHPSITAKRNTTGMKSRHRLEIYNKFVASQHSFREKIALDLKTYVGPESKLNPDLNMVLYSEVNQTLDLVTELEILTGWS